MDRQLPAALAQIAARQQGALTGRQISGVVGDAGLRNLVRRGSATMLWRNAYALPERAADALTRVHAAEMTRNGPITACLQTAAELYGFDLLQDARTHLICDHDYTNCTTGIITHRYLPVRSHVVLDGHRIADLGETAVRMACRESDPGRVLAVLDRALARTALTRDALAQVAADLHIRGISLTRELIGLADGRAESPGESWLRWVCIEAGFPPATPQIWVTDDHGHRYRVDLGWEELRVGCEYEGVEFHTGEALTADRARYNALGRQRWLMHGVTHSMIWRERRTLVADIRSLLDLRSAA